MRIRPLAVSHALIRYLLTEVLRPVGFGVTFQPTISVVIPSLNQGRFLGRCLQSIVDQEYSRTEILLIDGGSSDETARVAEEYRNHITLWVSEDDSGQSEALNRGFAAATGQIFCWLNADDYFLDGAFGAAIAAFERVPTTSAVYGDWLEVDEHEDLIIRRYALDVSLRHAQYRAFSALAQAMFWRREAHERFGTFPTDLHQAIDNYMILNLVINEGPQHMLRLPFELAAFRRHGHQKTGNLDKGIVQKELEYIDTALGLSPRRGLAGELERLGLSAHRAFQYWRRGGIRYLIEFTRFAMSNR